MATDYIRHSRGERWRDACRAKDFSNEARKHFLFFPQLNFHERISGKFCRLIPVGGQIAFSIAWWE